MQISTQIFTPSSRVGPLPAQRYPLRPLHYRGGGFQPLGPEPLPWPRSVDSALIDHAPPVPVTPPVIQPARLPQHQPSFLNRLSEAVGPSQTIALFTGGVVASLGGRLLWDSWRDFKSKPLQALKRPPKINSVAMENLPEKFNFIIASGIPLALTASINYSGHARTRALGYISALGLGYLAGNFLQAIQEIWIRREETKIRADLLEWLTDTFRRGIQTKTQYDTRLRNQAKVRIHHILEQFLVPQPGELVQPMPDEGLNPQYRYPAEPVHFDRPVNPSLPAAKTLMTAFQPIPFQAAAARPARFQGSGPPPVLQPLPIMPSEPWHLLTLKTAVFGTGFLAGSLVQGLWKLVSQPGASLFGIKPKLKTSAHTTYSIMDENALVFMGNRRVLLFAFGLTAFAKAAKSFLDGYREIEVTRQHAHTELHAQAYTRLKLDPTYHAIAEEEALNDELRKLVEALPRERYNRQALSVRIQTILSNIGRNSTPKYMPMTPFVNLVAARG